MIVAETRPIPQPRSPTCSASPRLTGNRCRCPTCEQLFNSISAFDRHRVGPWTDRGAHRRCLTVPEMATRGWGTNAAGFWIEKPYQNARVRLDRTLGSGDHLEPMVPAGAAS